MGSKSKQPAARIGDIDTGHPPAPPTPIITGSGNVFINGIPAARKGDMLVPHHPGVRIITEGSGSVNINGKPAARVTDAINCGGKIVIGSGNVFIGDNPPSGNTLAPGEWQDYIDSSIAAGNLSTYQSQQMLANMAVKYRDKAAGVDSWKEYYSGTVTPRPRPDLSSVQDPIERDGLQQAINQQAEPAPTLPNPAQQQTIDSAGQQMVQAIKGLAEGEMVTPEMLNLASTMLKAGSQESTTPPVSTDKSPLNAMYKNLQPMNPEYKGEETGSYWGTKVKYLDENERQQYKLTIRNGKLYDSSGDPFDTSSASSVFSSGKGNAIFVMDEFGNIYASKSHTVGKFHHSSFLSGKPVTSAGEITVKDGQLVSISRRSGHYQPTEAQSTQFLSNLRSNGVDLTEVDIKAGF